MIVTMMLIIVITIPTSFKIIPNTNCAYLSLYFPYIFKHSNGVLQDAAANNYTRKNLQYHGNGLK